MMNDNIPVWKAVVIILVVVTISMGIVLQIVESSVLPNDNQEAIDRIRREAKIIQHKADSLQAVIDLRELQIKTIYETLDHIPDYVRGMSAAERDSLRAILNPRQ